MKLTGLMLFLAVGPLTNAGIIDPRTEKYIINFQDIAIEQMEKYKIPASITIAQGILESNSGESSLTKKSNNHFGIKCHSTWTGERTYANDDAENECFRVYASSRESFEDHSLFLQNNKRYKSLFTLKENDYKGWAEGLQSAGYATNPSYAKILIKLIEDNKLYLIDKGKKWNEQIYASKESEYLYALSPNFPAQGNSKIKRHINKVRYIIAEEGDTYYKIAKRTDLTLHQLHRYNESNPNVDHISKGEHVYIDPKRIRSKEKDILILSNSTTIRNIAQQEALKIRPLLRRNHVSSADEQLPKGRKVFLR